MAEWKLRKKFSNFGVTVRYDVYPGTAVLDSFCYCDCGNRHQRHPVVAREGLVTGSAHSLYACRVRCSSPGLGFRHLESHRLVHMM
jgi:hypothetical protein